MKKGIIIAGLIVVVLIWFFGTKNSLVSKRENVEMQKSQIGTTLQRRSDLIPNLVETVKGYTVHEETVFAEVAEAREKITGSMQKQNIEEISKANDSLNSALSRLIAISEAYPDLKANTQFIALQDELAGTENRIAVARQHYNEKATRYNVAVQSFPTSIVASISGFYPIQYFEADENSKELPKVKF